MCYLCQYTVGLYLRRVPFGEIGCTIEGFFAFLTGVASLWILALLSINRYCLVFYPLYLSRVSVKLMLSILGGYLFVNILWSFMPIFGWSNYAYEFNGLQCAMNYYSYSFSVISFNITTLLFFWLAPISIGCYTNFKILLIVRLGFLTLFYNNLIRFSFKKLKNRSKWIEYLYFTLGNEKVMRKKINQLLIVVILNCN
jgi:small-conductance mechanosensitive channel